MLLFVGSQRVGHDWATELHILIHVCLILKCIHVLVMVVQIHSILVVQLFLNSIFVQ